MGRMLTAIAIFFLFTGAWWDRQEEASTTTQKATPSKQTASPSRSYNTGATTGAALPSDMPTPETIAMIQSMDSEFFKQMVTDDPEETRRRFEALAQIGRMANQMKGQQ